MINSHFITQHQTSHLQQSTKPSSWINNNMEESTEFDPFKVNTSLWNTLPAPTLSSNVGLNNHNGRRGSLIDNIKSPTLPGTTYMTSPTSVNSELGNPIGLRRASYTSDTIWETDTSHFNDQNNNNSWCLGSFPAPPFSAPSVTHGANSNYEFRRHSYSNDWSYEVPRNEINHVMEFAESYFGDTFTMNDKHVRLHPMLSETDELSSFRTLDLPSIMVSNNDQVQELGPELSLILIGFKNGRADIFYFEDSNIRPSLNDLVIVEADRGRDLGKVLKVGIDLFQARVFKYKQFRVQQAALISDKDNSHQTSNSNFFFPKQVVKFASNSEISQLLSKSVDEEKAKNVCLLKIVSHNLQMSVVDAEYQWDRRKLTFYYHASHRIDFRDLVRELFRVYKTRIWMCAVSLEVAA
ncbi:BA75_02364T0 [Komagataella pastoris]|uniref:BA75_02364T0 n=1 Tax=Komagataella pastoris TaxID=4922 RepID=A0A1B2JDY0_PICPA|nr:BA75_02364T0 [Komagataella pastoris]